MSAASEYYGYLLSQGYGEHQINKFAAFATQADRGEISHNQAYKMACGAGFNSAAGDEKKNFGDWMTTAKEAGWIDSGLGILGGLINRKQSPSYTPPPPPPKKHTALYVIGAVAVIGTGLAIYFATRKK